MSHIPLITKTDIGYNLSSQNGSYSYYIGEQKNNGVSYKNYQAFYTGVGICYIPEAAFENETGIEQKGIQQYTDILKSFKVNYEFVLSSNEVNDFSYTRNDIQQLIIKTIELEWKNVFIYQTMDIFNHFVQQLTFDVFCNVEWECVETYLNEIDIYACWEEFLKSNVQDLKE